MPDPYIFSWVALSAADISADNPNRIKILLANGASALFISGKAAAINGNFGSSFF